VPLILVAMNLSILHIQAMFTKGASRHVMLRRQKDRRPLNWPFTSAIFRLVGGLTRMKVARR